MAPYRDLAYVYEGQSKVTSVREPDLSPCGMFINTAEPFSEGAVLKVEFRLPDSHEVIKVRGEVRYCLPGVGIGLEFIEISPSHQEAIRRQVQRARGMAVPDAD